MSEWESHFQADDMYEAVQLAEVWIHVLAERFVTYAMEQAQSIAAGDCDEDSEQDQLDNEATLRDLVAASELLEAAFNRMGIERIR